MDILRRFRTFLFFLSLPAFPQQSPPQPPEPAPAPVSAETSHRITLNVVVTGKDQKPVLHLQARDFTILDNKAPQKLLSFQAAEGTTAEPPVEIVLLFDRVNTSALNVANAMQGAKNFLLQNGGRLAQPVSLVFFSDAGTTMENATRDGNALVAALDRTASVLRVHRVFDGTYGSDRFLESFRALNSVVAAEQKKPGRKILIWIGPGWPVPPQLLALDSSAVQRRLFDDVVAASTAMLQARITLYSVDPAGVSSASLFRTAAYEPFLKGARSPRQALPGNLELQVLAFQSGGKALISSNDIASAIAKCAEDANAYYALSFDVPPAHGENEYHWLAVKIDKPGFTARTLAWYYAQP